MSRYMNRIAFIAALAAILVATVLCVRRSKSVGPGPAFSAVSDFEEPASIAILERNLQGDYQLLLVSLAGGDVRVGATISARRANLVSDMAVAEDRLYFVVNDHLYEADMMAQVTRRLSITSFQLHGAQFLSPMVADREWLYFAASLPDDRWAVIRWNPLREPETRDVVVMRVPIGSIAPEPGAVGRVMVLPFARTIAFQEGTAREVALESIFYSADWDPKHGILLSSSDIAGSSDEIVALDAMSGVRRRITAGGLAVWGGDGRVYFCRGDRQLWRCKPDGSEEEPVFIGVGRTQPMLGPMSLSASRGGRYIVFSYIMGNGLDRKSSLLVVDVAREQLVLLPRTSVGAWAVLSEEGGSAEELAAPSE